MITNEFLNKMSSISHNKRDYARSFASYVSNKTAIFRDLRQIFLSVYRDDILFVKPESDINNDDNDEIAMLSIEPCDEENLTKDYVVNKLLQVAGTTKEYAESLAAKIFSGAAFAGAKEYVQDVASKLQEAGIRAKTTNYNGLNDYIVSLDDVIPEHVNKEYIIEQLTNNSDLAKAKIHDIASALTNGSVVPMPRDTAIKVIESLRKAGDSAKASFANIFSEVREMATTTDGTSVGQIDESILPRDYWYTPICLKDVYCGGVRQEHDCIVTAKEFAIAISNKLRQDNSTIGRVKFSNNDYKAYATDLIENLCQQDYATIDRNTGYFTLVFPYPVLVTKSSDGEYLSSYAAGDAIKFPAACVDPNSELYKDFVITRDQSSLPYIEFSIPLTLAAISADVVSNDTTSTVLEMLGRIDEVSVSDITMAIQQRVRSLFKLRSCDEKLVSIATDSSYDVDDRITMIIDNIRTGDGSLATEEVEEAATNQVYDDSVGAVFFKDNYSGQSMSSIWKTAFSESPVVSALCVVGAVIVAVAQAVWAVLKVVWKGVTKLWKKYIEPAYNDKVFVQAGRTKENHCDIPLFFIGSEGNGVPYSSDLLASLLASQLQSRDTLDLAFNPRISVRKQADEDLPFVDVLVSDDWLSTVEASRTNPVAKEVIKGETYFIPDSLRINRVSATGHKYTSQTASGDLSQIPDDIEAQEYDNYADVKHPLLQILHEDVDGTITSYSQNDISRTTRSQMDPLQVKFNTLGGGYSGDQLNLMVEYAGSHANWTAQGWTILNNLGREVGCEFMDTDRCYMDIIYGDDRKGSQGYQRTIFFTTAYDEATNTTNVRASYQYINPEYVNSSDNAHKFYMWDGRTGRDMFSISGRWRLGTGYIPGTSNRASLQVYALNAAALSETDLSLKLYCEEDGYHVFTFKGKIKLKSITSTEYVSGSTGLYIWPWGSQPYTLDECYDSTFGVKNTYPMLDNMIWPTCPQFRVLSRNKKATYFSNVVRVRDSNRVRFTNFSIDPQNHDVIYCIAKSETDEIRFSIRQCIGYQDSEQSELYPIEVEGRSTVYSNLPWNTTFYPCLRSSCYTLWHHKYIFGADLDLDVDYDVDDPYTDGYFLRDDSVDWGIKHVESRNVQNVRFYESTFAISVSFRSYISSGLYCSALTNVKLTDMSNPVWAWTRSPIEVYEATQSIRSQWISDDIARFKYRPLNDLDGSLFTDFLSTVANPLDEGCATVIRNSFLNIELIREKDSGKITAAGYLCPLNYSALMDDKGVFRYWVAANQGGFKYYHMLEDGTRESLDHDAFFNSFFDSLSSATSSPSDYSFEEGDQQAYRDLKCAKYLADLYLWAICNNDTSVEGWFIETSASTALSGKKSLKLLQYMPIDDPDNVTNKMFYQLIYAKDENSPSLPQDKASMVIYCIIAKIVSNKPQYLRLFYATYAEWPEFFPYIVGDLMGSPKWHINTDNDIQRYVTIVCTALIIAAMVIAAAILIGVVAIKIKKAIRTKRIQNEAREWKDMDDISTSLSDQEENKSAIERVQAKLKDPSKFEEGDTAESLNESLKKLKEESKDLAKNHKKLTKRAYKNSRKNARFEKLASLFGLPEDAESEAVAAASYDISIPDVTEAEAYEGVTDEQLAIVKQQLEANHQTIIDEIGNIDSSVDLLPVTQATAEVLRSVLNLATIISAPKRPSM